jgi:AcrR family transcriptional regulator
MSALAAFSRDDFLKSAMELIAGGGPRAATTTAIVHRCRATVGSFYYRFASRDDLLAELWLTLAEGYQHAFFALLRAGDVAGAALFTPRWVRKHPREARVLLLHHRDDFVDKKWPPAFVKRAHKLAAELDGGLNECATRLLGSPADAALQRLRFALIEVPLAAVRRELAAGRPIPRLVDQLVLECCQAVLPGLAPDEKEKKS